MTNYYKSFAVDSVRPCPDLVELRDEDRNNWHTMGGKLLLYVSAKFTNQQIGFIEQCLRRNTPIQVHGVFEEHLTDCLQTHNLRQRRFENGLYRLDRLHKSVNTKDFNLERPFFVNTVDHDENPVALFVTFPSKEYVSQTAELLFAFVKLNLQLIIFDKDLESIGLNEGTKSRLNFKKAEAKEILESFLSNNQVRQYYYPNSFNAFPDWSGLEAAAGSGLIRSEDIVVIGYVDRLAELLIREHGFRAAQFEHESKRFYNFGPKELFGAAVLVSENERRRVVLLGFKHSFWGKTASMIADTCLRAGASHIVYVAKAGTRTGRIKPVSGGDPSKHYLCLIGGQYLVWEGGAENPEGKVREVTPKASQNQFANLFTNKADKANASKSHLSVPTVVGEDFKQFQAYGHYNPSSIDNEISYIAEAIGKFETECLDRKVTFSCIHFITDLVVSNLNLASSSETGLDKDHQLLPEKVEFWAATAEKLASFIETNGAPSDSLPLKYDRKKSDATVSFDRYGYSIEYPDQDKICSGIGNTLDILACYPKIADRPKLEYAILSAGKGDSFLFLGEAGSGKSVLAENLYFFLKDAYERNDFSFRPYYIDITSYEKSIIHDGERSVDVWNAILTRLANAIDELGPLVVIYDGIEEQSPFRSGIVDFLRRDHRTQRERESVSIFFQRVYRNVRTDDRGKLRVLGVDVGIDDCFELGSLAHNDGRVVEVKEDLNRLLALTSRAEGSIVEELTFRIASWPEFTVNLRLLNLVLEYEKRRNQVFDGPTSFFRQFSIDYLKDNSAGMAIDRLKKLAEMRSYEFLIDSKSFPLETAEDVLVKRLATQSMEMLCYLTAKHLDFRLFEMTGYNEDRVFPHLINKYSKELLRKRDQNVAFARLKSVLSDEKSGVRLKSFATYLLGRINTEDLRRRAVEVLVRAKSDLDVEVKEGNERQLLIFDRSINISLIYLGEDSHDYILKLMSSRSHDEINRGFHLAYYGDIDYFGAPDMLSADDGVSSFNRSAANLEANLCNDGLGSNLLNLSAYTLYSLAYTRFVNSGSIAHAMRVKLVNLANENLLQNRAIHSDVKDYIGNCVRYLDSGIGADALAFTQVARLKSHDRAGWNDVEHGRSVPNCETVFAHVASATYLAVAYLPDDATVSDLVRQKVLPSAYSEYCKDRVIQMLAIHDIGEHDAGDIATPYKTAEDLREERNSVRFLTMLSTRNRREGFGGYSGSVWELWCEFEEKRSINALVARDVDVLESLLQLSCYSRDEENKLQDFDNFKRKLQDGFCTEIGKSLSAMFTRSFFGQD